ncbi:MAG TPA: L-seryl-tRNA(Sec) selenium transferase [Spirochaetota bacterium]|nr:L-seryl-tRNA(Sec) selenium transferase [Spirochaetota bacterium]
MNELLRNIPQVEKLLQDDEIAAFIPEIGRSNVTALTRRCTEKYRTDLLAGAAADAGTLKSMILEACIRKRKEKIQRVINCTGVVIHTNLGRAPLGEDIFTKLKDEISGYCNLEFSIPEKKRGKRGGFAEEMICTLTGGGDALIVNNNASSVFLILKEFAEGKEAIVSRGELIQIGGGFRIPDIMAQSGAKLVEVGTTNITTIDDYAGNITGNTGMLFSAHTSNFKIKGFTESPSLKELASLKNENVIFVRDLGSGNLTETPIRSFEQTVYSELIQGPDLVCFSGDKLLGGCQAGIITGRKDLIARLRKNPLMRMLRVDKITYMILQEVLLKYVNSAEDTIELRSMIMRKHDEVSHLVTRFIRMCGPAKDILNKIKVRGTFGGGSMPGKMIESWGIEVNVPGMSPDAVYDYFLSCTPPVTGVVQEGNFILNFLTVFERDLKELAGAVKMLAGETGK